MTNENGTRLFCMGLGLGIAVAFLFAPRSGRDSRQYLRDKAGDGAGYLKRQAQDMADSAVDALESGAKAVRRQKENVKGAVDAGRAAVRDALSAMSAGDLRI